MIWRVGESTFQMDEDWLVFNPSPSPPSFVLPPGAVDAHCHIFGPGDVFPFAAERKYTPYDAPKEKLWALRDYLGFERNVIVQATCHGTDNRALLDALKSAAGRARGVASVQKTVTDEMLQVLHDAGVRAVRFNFVKRLVDALPHEVLAEIAERVSLLGWHTVIYFESQDLAQLYDFISSLPGTVVVDHMGRPDVGLPVDGAEFELFLKLLSDNHNFYSKVSCPERLSSLGPPKYLDVLPFARTIIEAFPDRVLWGTDWPHPNMKAHMPDDGKLVDIIPLIASTPTLQHKLLVDNPMNLYWPEEVD
jgi:2-pyrone-4,6-dicarboxylate lactonase